MLHYFKDVAAYVIMMEVRQIVPIGFLLLHLQYADGSYLLTKGLVCLVTPPLATPLAPTLTPLQLKIL